MIRDHKTHIHRIFNHEKIQSHRHHSFCFAEPHSTGTCRRIAQRRGNSRITHQSNHHKLDNHSDRRSPAVLQ